MEKTLKAGTRASLYLLGLALVLLGVTFLYERGRPLPEPAPLGEEPQPVIARPEAVTSLRLQNRVGQFTFAREDQKSPWQMTEPIASNVEPIYVELMVRRFLNLKKERIVAQGDQELGQFGLADPAGRVTFHFRDSDEEVILELGKLNPTKEALFARVLGRPEIFLADRFINQYLSRGLADFRLSWLLQAKDQEVASLEIRYRDPALQRRFRRAYSTRLVSQTAPDGEVQWMMLEPFSEQVSADAVGHFINGLRQEIKPQVVEGAKADLARLGLDHPALEVIMGKNDQSLERVLFSRPSPDGKSVYIYHPGWEEIFQAPLANVARVFDREFRTVYVLPPGAQETFSRVAVSFPKERKSGYTLARTPAGTWQVEGNPQPGAKGVNPFWILGPLAEQAANGYYIYDRNPKLGAYGLDQPRAVIQLNEADQRIADLAIGAATADPAGCYILDRRRDALLWIPGDIYPKIPPDQGVFRQTQSLGPNPTP